MSARSAVIEPIVLQYAEEASFLWLLRDAAVGAPHYSLADLVKLDDRIEAHLDGLRIAGDEGWDICQNELQWLEAGEIFTAAVLAFEAGDVARIQPVLELARGSVELSRGLVSALGWLSYEKIAPRISQLTAAGDADLCRIGIAAGCAHSRNPGKVLIDSVSSDDTPLRARALRAAGQLGRTDLLPHLRSHLNDPDDKCRFSAAWSAAVLGDNPAIDVLKSMAMVDSSFLCPAMEMALRRMSLADALGWQRQLAQQSDLSRTAVIAVGVIGDPVLVPWLIEQIPVSELARAAGESFTMITGADIALLDLEGDKPERFESGPTENPEDENISLDPDEDLPWPDAELIRHWWDAHKKDMPTGTRYLLGKPMTAESLAAALRTGHQRQRAAAALELAIRQTAGKKPLFEVRAPGVRQRQLLR